jgi:ketosteroid isomerase-like protein
MTQIREIYLFILTFGSIQLSNMKKMIPFIAILFAQNLCAQNNDTTQQKPIDCFEIVSDVSDYKENIKAIQAILDNQITAWNKGDLEAFMSGYLKSDSLVFIGKSGPTYGYDKTLSNYKKNYPDASHMGKLSFKIVSMKPLGGNYYFVIGKWYLKRTVGDINGVYTLVLRNTKDGWKIIADHSS